jgi:iron complex outermembrane receptor protein
LRSAAPILSAWFRTLRNSSSVHDASKGINMTRSNKSANLNLRSCISKILALAAAALVADFALADDQLQDVVVTAQRVTANSQSVPVALTAMDAGELENRQAFSLVDAKYLAPSLYVEENLSNPATPKIFMRGIGQANSAFSFDTPVGIYVDDVYYAKEVGSMVDFLDIDHIEVLRGPQGTIYGRNSSVGAIRVVSRSAPLDSTDASGDITFGSYHERDARVSFGTPLIEDTLGFRVAVVSRYNDGYEYNTVNGDRANSTDSNAIRAQLLAKFNDDVTFTVRGDYLRDNSRPAVAINFLNNDIQDLRFQSEDSYSLGTVGSKIETFGGSGTLNWNFGNGMKLTSITAYRGVNTKNSFDADGTTVNSFEVPRSDLHDRSFTQEVWLTGKNANVDWVAGAFYLTETTGYVWSLEILGPPSVQNFDQEVNSLAGYVQGTVHLTDHLNLVAGGRYTSEHKDFDAVSHLPDGSFDFGYSNHDLNTDKWTWRASADYSFAQPIMVYASAATGFRSGGLNGNATSLPDVTGGGFQPEDTLMYELGVKSDFLDHKLRLNADYFWGKYDNLQQAVVENDGSVNQTSASAKVNGLELEARALPVTGLELYLTLSTLNNTIEDSSEKLPVAPHLQYSVGGTYTHRAGHLGDVSLGTTYSWSDKVYEDTSNTPILVVPSHGNLDAHLSVAPDDHWKFTVAGENLTDKVYAVGGFYIAGGFIAATQWPSPPRRWSFNVFYRY